MAATSEHLFSFGGKVEYSTNVLSPSYTEITDVKKITVPGYTVGESEDTQLNSPSAVKEFSGGWITVDDCELETYLVVGQDTTLISIGRAKILIRITYPKTSTQVSVGTTVVFLCFIKQRKPTDLDVGSDDELAQTWTLKVSGPVTITAGS